MEFLVAITVDLPSNLDGQTSGALLTAERERGRELLGSGTIYAIWRIPDPRRLRNVGVWRADDEVALRSHIQTLPLFPYMTVEVTALQDHPLTTLSTLESRRESH